MKLRCYQVEACKALWECLHDPDAGHILCVSPTGTGKTVKINATIKKLMLRYKKLGVMVITHNKDIIGQNEASMRKFWRKADTGIYSAGIKRRETQNRVLYTGIQSVHKRADEFRKIGVMFVDEAHLLSPNDGTMYKRFVDRMLELNPKMRLVLFSATPYRMGQGHLLDTDWADTVAFDYTETEKFMWFVHEGYLSKLVTKRAAKEIDITDCAIRGGEFNDKDLQRLSNTEENNKAVVEECIRYGSDRNHWMVFASGVDHGYELAKMFESYGIRAISLHAKSPSRDEELKRWESGDYKVMVNVGLYTTGYDFPALDMIAVARATQSTALWVQMLGRGTRPVYASEKYPETKEERLAAIEAGPKQNCLVLDFAGNTRRLGPINAPIIPKPRKKGQANEGEAPVKECPECKSYVHASVRECEECGYVFPPKEKEVDKTAGTDEIMVNEALEPNVKEIQVQTVGYKARTSRNTGREYFMCSYHTLNGTYQEYLYPGHPADNVREIFNSWWWHRLADEDKKLYKDRKKYRYPLTVEAAVARAGNELIVPTIVRVDFNTKYKNVTGASFENYQDQANAF
jgi:DNA repair protein RadD|tara:strand:- start:652 stop:2373 length:1722 start_codon:yes stop_codon:yes gene_type:complete